MNLLSEQHRKKQKRLFGKALVLLLGINFLWGCQENSSADNADEEDNNAIVAETTTSPEDTDMPAESTKQPTQTTPTSGSTKSLPSITLTSTAFQNKGLMPAKYTCEAEDGEGLVSPPLAWGKVPAGTKSLVLIVDDPDAPDPKAPKRIWVHWVLYNLPPETTQLPEGVISEDLPTGTLEGLNDWKTTGYRGPCPPIGQHRYFHKLYALDQKLSLQAGATKQAVEAAMQDHKLAQGELIGLYQNQQ